MDNNYILGMVLTIVGSVALGGGLSAFIWQKVVDKMMENVTLHDVIQKFDGMYYTSGIKGNKIYIKFIPFVQETGEQCNDSIKLCWDLDNLDGFEELVSSLNDIYSRAEKVCKNHELKEECI